MSNQGYYGQQPQYQQPAYGYGPPQPPQPAYGYPPQQYGPPQGQYGYGQPQYQTPQYVAPGRDDRRKPQRSGGDSCFKGCLVALCCCCAVEEGCECCADCCECAEDCC